MSKYRQIEVIIDYLQREKETNRARKAYQLTTDGGEAFRDKIPELLNEPENPRWQADVAFNNMGVIPMKEQKELMRGYRTALEHDIRDFSELEKTMLDLECCVQHVSIVRRWIFVTEGEIRWVDDFLSRLS